MFNNIDIQLYVILAHFFLEGVFNLIEYPVNSKWRT